MQLIIILSLGILGLAGLIQASKIVSGDYDYASLSSFDDFIKKYNKVYKSTAEYTKRFEIFKSNLKRAEELQKAQKGTAEYGVTIFADLTVEEFKKRQGLKRSQNSISYPKAKIPDIKLPKNYDWRHYNVVTPVKDQGQCGSCWTFSTTGNVEGQYALKYNKLLSLSEQEIVDCDKLDSGCDGGYPFLAYQSVQDIGGLELESDYPYTGVNGTCNFAKEKVAVKINGGVELSTNEDDIAKWLVANGPVSIAINADDMQLYKKGISDPSSCDVYNLDHAVLIVGYGVKTVKSHNKIKKIPFWVIKNSWGTSWGESNFLVFDNDIVRSKLQSDLTESFANVLKGYYRVVRGKGTCGLNLNPSSAVVA